MFTGIIETLGTVVAIEKDATNIHFTISSSISNELKIDQSIAHNGVCLTVIKCDEQTHTVTAIDETLRKTNLNSWKVGDTINLERCMVANGRLDGHIVQGHVDTVGMCIARVNKNGSWLFTFSHPFGEQFLTVEKGSITVNGTSLTVVNSKDGQFSVAIIPYTYEHTNFHQIEIGTQVNLEFDIIGKYVARLMGRV
ncbi:MAG: riboflavin synthase [Flavobacteriales bacterium]|nr:riboflavin synthase [Flavobacteriales bacterium]